MSIDSLLNEESVKNMFGKRMKKGTEPDIVSPAKIVGHLEFIPLMPM
jgi:hypothetical protein